MSTRPTPSTGKCLVCGSQDLREEFRCTDYFVTGELFPLYRCSECGFRFTASPPPEEKIARYYQSEAYISHSDTSKGLVSQVYHLVRSFMVARKASVVRKSAGICRGSLLDIGAGTGFFLHYMQKKGWQVTGTEVNATARGVADAEHGLHLLAADGLYTLPDHSFDVITLWHVLEHLYDQGRFWQEFTRLLRPGGTLVIALPNPGSWDAGHYREYWAAWDTPRHLWHFTPSNLEMLAKQFRFRLDKTFRMPFDSFYVSILSEKYKKSTLPLLRGIWYGKVSWWKALSEKKRCSSLIYILKPA